MLENLFDDIIEEVAPEEVAPMRNTTLGQKSNRCRLSIALQVATTSMRPRRWRICCVWRGRVRSHQVRFADVPLSDVSYPRRFEEAGLVFVSLISTSAPARVRYLVRRISTARAGRESFGRPVGIVTGRARRRESGAWRLGRYRHERTRCPCRGARSSQQIRQ